MSSLALPNEICRLNMILWISCDVKIHQQNWGNRSNRVTKDKSKKEGKIGETFVANLWPKNIK